MRDDTGLSVVRKSMIRCGLRKNITSVWEEKQLTLQELIKKHREYFEGKAPEAVGALAVSELYIFAIYFDTLISKCETNWPLLVTFGGSK
ncbi:TPA: hypothetical protein N0F65_011274 [Lagenidium giganteum]|uniref:Uncharacterized protein n=1 Tax=Lagenidium giganteum TaxID=4803 RepID=A0AAV2YTQ3_9STRA|nr:TPA: hypothetical protein N0F65_011274 [Lagenidium giganteum]